MANFDTTLSRQSYVKYADNGKHLWNPLCLSKLQWSTQLSCLYESFDFLYIIYIVLLCLVYENTIYITFFGNIVYKVWLYPRVNSVNWTIIAGTAFTVEWENVKLQDKPDAGAFTFQVTLLQNGDIIFVYSKIPVLVESIEDKEHPVKIGLSDAYMMDRTVFCEFRLVYYCTGFISSRWKYQCNMEKRFSLKWFHLESFFLLMKIGGI